MAGGTMGGKFEIPPERFGELKPEEKSGDFETEETLFEGPRKTEPIFKFTKKEQTSEGEEIEKQYVSVLGVELPVRPDKKNGSWFKEEEFERFSLDKMSLEILKKFAIGIKLSQPPLLEGETDIGKTKTAEYLSWLTNTRLIRLSFSGQTDISEFIGKFAPSTKTGKEKFENLLKNEEGLTQDSKEIIKKSKEEDRNLTLEESRKIAKNEGLDIKESNWEWHDGLLPKAMQFNNGEGCWAYFDEIGAAEPAILVKLNRVFEKFSRLEIYEQGGKTVEAGPNFRIIASTNPPEYVGRAPLAPDLLRRFVYQKVGSLDLETLKQRTSFLLVKEKRFGQRREPSFIELASRPHKFEDEKELAGIVNEALTEFHYAAQKAVEGGLAKDQKQPFRYDFSDVERTIQFLNQLQGPDILKTMEEAIEFYYCGKLISEESKDKLRQIWQQTLKLHRISEKIKDLTEPPKEKKSKTEKAVGEKIEIGSIPEGCFVTSFSKSPNPKTMEENFINRVAGRKMLVLAKESKIQPEEEKEYVVRPVRETYPGLNKGVIFVEILGKSPKEKFKEQKEKEGYVWVDDGMPMPNSLKNVDLDFIIKNQYGRDIPFEKRESFLEEVRKEIELEKEFKIEIGWADDNNSLWIKKEAADKIEALVLEFKRGLK